MSVTTYDEFGRRVKKTVRVCVLFRGVYGDRNNPSPEDTTELFYRSAEYDPPEDNAVDRILNEAYHYTDFDYIEVVAAMAPSLARDVAIRILHDLCGRHWMTR